MKKLFIVGLLVAALSFGLSGVAMATVNPVVTSPAADVTATVVVQLTIARDFHLVFPHVLVQGQTRVVTPAGAGAGGSAQFTVTGLAGASIDVTVPPNVTIADAVVPTPNTMLVTLTPGAGQIGVVTIGTDGTHVVHVGGTVTADPLQAAGDYTGTFTITAVYL